MSKKMMIVAVCAAFVASLASCATAYQSKGASGGYSATQLGPKTWQVRFQGNGYTSNDKVSVFILRRAAELVLENDFRYFRLAGQQTQTAHSMDFSFPNQSATVIFLDQPADDALDAVLVVRSTDEQAGGRLSATAEATLRKFEADSKP